jgi:hypothetical protein
MQFVGRGDTFLLKIVRKRSADPLFWLFGWQRPIAHTSGTLNVSLATANATLKRFIGSAFWYF